MEGLRSIAILDDEPLIIAALKNDLANYYNILCVAKTVQDFFINVEKNQPDLVLLDILLGKSSGIDVARILREKYPKIKILVLSIDNRRETFRQLLTIGIDGFISKNSPTTEVVHAVDVVIRGEKYYGKDVSRLINEIQTSMLSGKEPQMSKIEVDILYACCEGKNSSEIGTAMGISPSTVESHKSSLFVKLGVDSTIELIVKAIKLGIITI